MQLFTGALFLVLYKFLTFSTPQGEEAFSTHLQGEEAFSTHLQNNKWLNYKMVLKNDVTAL